MASASILARNVAKKRTPTHDNQSEASPVGHTPHPPGPSLQHHGQCSVPWILFDLSRGGVRVRCLEPAHRIEGYAVSSRFGLIRAWGGVRKSGE